MNEGLKQKCKIILLYCDICGNDQFSTIDDIEYELKDAPDETKIQCSACGKIFAKAELIELNQEGINANIKDIKNEAVKELKNEQLRSY